MNAFRESSLHVFQLDTDIEKGFPHIMDSTTLAHHLGIRNKILNWILKERSKESAYHCFGIPEFKADKTLKKIRHIQTPVKFAQLNYVHEQLNRWFSAVELPDSITAYRKSQSVLDDAKQHIRKSYHFIEGETSDLDQSFMGDLMEDPRYKTCIRYKVRHDKNSPKGLFFYQPFVAIQIDISNFFNSIRASWIRKYFQEEIGYPHHVAYKLAQLCTVKQSYKTREGKVIERRFLPQGSPLSGSLANLIAAVKIANKVQEFLDSHSEDWVFTMYSDDLFLTHPDQTITPEEVHKVQHKVLDIIREAGFRINRRKVKIKRTKYERIVRLGIVINENPNIKKEEVQKIKNQLIKIKEYGWDFDKSEDATTVDKRIEILKGKIEWIRQIKPEVGEYLTDLLNEDFAAHPVQDNNLSITF